MAKRKYTKRNAEYWNNLSKGGSTSTTSNKNTEGFKPNLVGDSFYQFSSKARRSSSDSTTHTRRNVAASAAKYLEYENIRQGMMPYCYGANGVDVRDAIELCQKAYYNVAVFRNAIDMMADFSNSNLYLEGGSKKSKRFVEAWFKKIKIWKLKDQYFREAYRSGNIFIYTLESVFDANDYTRFSSTGLTPKTDKIPTKYILLNPRDMTIPKSTSFENGSYHKVLSEYELERLKNPKNDEDREVFDALPDDAKELINQGSFHSTGVSIPLDPHLLRYSFYKKQDYEPFAVPFGFAVLDDINFKLEMKKIDQAICRTVENVILLITMGAEPDKGGVNPNNIEAMQQIFRNESVGRALVSDYTTKAEFIIPDIRKVIGPEKYKIVDQDIKEGLQNIILSEEKFASTEVKAKIFLQKLNEAREAFLNDFLQPEINKVCKDLGLKQAPTAKFEQIDLQDESAVQRVIVRMVELGILPPEEGIKVIETGVFPTPEDLKESQKRFLEERRKGLYNPLVGGSPVPVEYEDGLKINQPKEGGEQNDEGRAANFTSSNVGRPMGTKASYSVEAIKDTIDKTNNLFEFAVSKAKSIYKKSSLNDADNELIQRLCSSVVCAKSEDSWEHEVQACLEDSKKIIHLNPMVEILDTASQHNLDDYSGAILFHSQQIK